MTDAAVSTRPARAVIIGRLAWTMASLAMVQVLVCGLSALPIVVGWWWLLHWPAPGEIVRLAILSLAIVPSYALFALALMVVSPLGIRLVGWQTPPDEEMVVADLGWPLLTWVRYMASIHVVRLVSGTLFRATPIWTAYLRLSGARHRWRARCPRDRR